MVQTDLEASPDFAARPSRPRAALVWRLAVLVVLLLLACAAIWWIDRGAMLTNSSGR
jgi:hypothetical protein